MTADLNNNEQNRPAEHRPVDEYANFVTHGAGFFLSLIAAGVLMFLAVDSSQSNLVIPCGIYSFSLIALYAASTLSHSFHDLAWRRFFRTLDQACIFLLIAGSFTPFAAAYLNYGPWRYLMWAMWALAGFGIALVLHMRNLTPMAKVAYGLLGWLPIISLKVLFDTAPVEVMACILGGGLFYSTGAIFLRYDQRVRYFHAVWHLFVIAGSICHYLAIILLLRPDATA